MIRLSYYYSVSTANKEKITCTAEPTEENAPNPLIVDRKTEKLRTETINELGPFDDESSRNDIGVASSHISVKKIEATPVSRKKLLLGLWLI